jgi:hypothetical protein
MNASGFGKLLPVILIPTPAQSCVARCARLLQRQCVALRALDVELAAGAAKDSRASSGMTKKDCIFSGVKKDCIFSGVILPPSPLSFPRPARESLRWPPGQRISASRACAARDTLLPLRYTLLIE